MSSERDRRRLREVERGIGYDDPALAAELRTALRRRTWRYVLLTSAGVAVTVAGAVALNFDVLVLGLGGVVAGIVGIRRRGASEEQAPWSG